MHLALSVAVEKPSNEREKNFIGDLIKAFDKLLRDYEVEPVVWDTSETDSRFVFDAYIPGDCLPEFDECADFITEMYEDYKEQAS